MGRSDVALMCLQMVANLTVGMVEWLQLYQAKNKQLPERILIFRDGVSEVRLSLDGPRATVEQALHLRDKPGTIQDRSITNVYGFDWYLQVCRRRRLQVATAPS